MKKPSIFIEVLWNLAAPDFFNINLSEEEIENIYGEVLRLTKSEYEPPKTFLDWRDITFEAMENLGYELPDED